MIDGSEKCNRQLAFQLQNSHVCEKPIRICDRSAQFLVNCFEKLLWQQTVVDLIQPTCLPVS